MENQNTHIDAIGDDVLSEILGRLPTTNVFRLRCVCRRWRALLEDPNFPRIHASLFNSHPSWALVLRSKLTMDLAPPCVHDPLLITRHPRIPLEYKRLSPVAGCDGLLLCTNLRRTSYYVVSSITKEFVLIPPPPQNLVTHGHGLIASSDEAGLVMRSFHVVLLCEDYHPLHGFRHVVFLTFCSSNGMWSYRSFPYRPEWRVINYVLPPATPHKGVLYWIVWSNLTIMAYDTFKNPPEFYGIPLPGPWGQILGDGTCYHYNCLCGVMEGRFCFFDQNRLWILEDYREGVWRQDLSIPPVDDRILTDPRLFGSVTNCIRFGVYAASVPIAFNPFAKGMVCWCNDSIGYETLETRHMRFLCSFHDNPFFRRIHQLNDHEFPLVRPFWPSRIPGFAELVHGWAEE